MMNHIVLSASELRNFMGETKWQEQFKAFAVMGQHMRKMTYNSLTGRNNRGKVQLSIIMYETFTGNRRCCALSLV